MRSLGLSNEAMARRCNVARKTVSGWRQGGGVGIEAKAIAKALGVAEELLYLAPVDALHRAIIEHRELWVEWEPAA